MKIVFTGFSKTNTPFDFCSSKMSSKCSGSDGSFRKLGWVFPTCTSHPLWVGHKCTKKSNIFVRQGDSLWRQSVCISGEMSIVHSKECCTDWRGAVKSTIELTSIILKRTSMERKNGTLQYFLSQEKNPAQQLTECGKILKMLFSEFSYMRESLSILNFHAWWLGDQ